MAKEHGHHRSDDHHRPELAVVEGGEGADRLIGTALAEWIEGEEGDDLLDGAGGDDVLVGGEGRDLLLGGAGDDRLYGDDLEDDHDREGDRHHGDGRDRFADVLDGGAGSDRVHGGRGDDRLLYTAAENEGAHDLYDGGRGEDTLVLTLTRAEWFDPAFQTDLDRLRGWLAARAAADGEDEDGGRDADDAREADETFRFTAFDLETRDVEQVRIFVDGREVSLADDPVTAVDDAVSVGEDAGPTTFGSVLADDLVPDLARTVRLVSPPAAGTLVFRTGSDGNPDGSLVFDPGQDFQYLAVGETAQVQFTYEVADADGDTDTATVTITVQGANDAPVAVADVAGTDEDTPVAVDVLANDTDPDASDVLTVTSATVTSGGRHSVGGERPGGVGSRAGLPAPGGR